MRRMYSLNQIEEISKKTIENANSLKIFENIVDKDGHKRFIEDDITPNEITGVSYTYAKWSLSGTHLLIVLAGSIANGTAISGTIASIDLPSWIKSKLVPTYSTVVIRQNDNIFASDGSTSQSALNVVAKIGDVVAVQSYITATADRYFRYQFDILIDND